MGPSVKSRNLYSEYLFSQPLRWEKERVERDGPLHQICGGRLIPGLGGQNTSDQFFNLSVLRRVLCTVLHYWALHCTALQSTALQSTSVYCPFVHWCVLHYWALHCTALLSTDVYYTAVYYTIVYCSTVPGIVPELYCSFVQSNNTIAVQCSTVQ